MKMTGIPSNMPYPTSLDVHIDWHLAFKNLKEVIRFLQRSMYRFESVDASVS